MNMGRPGGNGVMGRHLRGPAGQAAGDALYDQFSNGDDATRWDLLNSRGNLGGLTGGFMRATGNSDPMAFNAQINRFGGGARPDGGMSAMPGAQGSMTASPQMLAGALRSFAGGGGAPQMKPGMDPSGMSTDPGGMGMGRPGGMPDLQGQQAGEMGGMPGGRGMLGGMFGGGGGGPMQMPGQGGMGDREYAGGSPNFDESSGQMSGLNRRMYPPAQSMPGQQQNARRFFAF